MITRISTLALALLASVAQAAPQPAPQIAFPWWPMQPVATAQAMPETPKTPEAWMTQMTDFTRNASAYKDPRVFVPWSHAVTEPGFYLTAVKGAMEPGGWLNMVNSMAHPDAVRNYMGFTDPNVYMRWMQAGMDPAFYTAMMTQFTDPGKMMRWAMMPLDPKAWEIAVAMVNPNTYIRWPMAGMDPRTWNFMGNVMNPALYTGMAGTMLNPGAPAQSGNPWLSWRPSNITGASSPWGQDPMASFSLLDPALLSNLAQFLPGLPSFGAQATVPAQPSAPAASVAVPKSQAPDSPQTDKFVLPVDVLFKPGKSGVRDLTKAGKARLDELAASIKAQGVVEQIKIIGHADARGKAEVNRKISDQRARAIKSYLVAKGVKPGVVITSGVGDTQPVAQCDKKLARAELVKCMEPNRRVEVEVVGKAK